MLYLVPGGRKSVVGNIAWHRSEVNAYLDLISGHATTVSEIGFGAGHTDAISLAGNRRAHTFDTFPWPHFPTPARQHRERTFGTERFTFMEGNSFNTVKNFPVSRPGVKCDVFLIDGSQDRGAIYTDALNLTDISMDENIVFFDDIQNLWPDLDRLVTEKALLRALRRGLKN